MHAPLIFGKVGQITIEQHTKEVLLKDPAFTLDMAVRDYECDLQGIVNNAVYQHYLEHARHEYLKQIGISFSELASDGINLVVVRAELDYRFPLTSGDHFTVYLKMEKSSALRITFYQDIHRKKDNKVILQAKITGTALNHRGRPQMPDILNTIFSKNAAAG